MKKIKYFFLFTGLLMMSIFLNGQDQESLAGKLGYPGNVKLLIVHADDLGVAHSVNAASVEAFNKKGITCGSIMVPCPWFPEMAYIARNHPEYDIGIHLTLTAEWDHYKWGGVLPANEIPSLINEDGYFYSSVEEVLQHADPAEVEKEIRAQIERAIAFGINPTHLDNHMGPLFMDKELIQIYLRVGKEYNLPVLLPSNYMGLFSMMGIREDITDIQAMPYIYMKVENSSTEDWKVFYNQILDTIQPGLNELIVHLAFNDDEMQAVAQNHPDYGAQWRQNDLDYLTGDEFRKMIEKNNIKLVTWGDIKKVLYPDPVP